MVIVPSYAAYTAPWPLSLRTKFGAPSSLPFLLASFFLYPCAFVAGGKTNFRRNGGGGGKACFACTTMAKRMEARKERKKEEGGDDAWRRRRDRAVRWKEREKEGRLHRPRER